MPCACRPDAARREQGDAFSARSSAALHGGGQRCRLRTWRWCSAQRLSTCSLFAWMDGVPRTGRAGRRQTFATGWLSELPVASREAQHAGYYIAGAMRRRRRAIHRLCAALFTIRSATHIVEQESVSASAVTWPRSMQLGLLAVPRLLLGDCWILDGPIDLTALSGGRAECNRRSGSRASESIGGPGFAEPCSTSGRSPKTRGWPSRRSRVRRRRAGRAWGTKPGPSVGVAIARDSLLPPKHRALAHGLQAWWNGDADSAVARLGQALNLDPEWAEGHMALGEVYYHLLPTAPLRLDSLAEVEFSRAARLDSGFAPPLYHLTEIALRAGKVNEAAALIERFRAFDPDTFRSLPLLLAYACVKDGPAAMQWSGEVSRHPMAVLRAGAGTGCLVRRSRRARNRCSRRSSPTARRRSCTGVPS